MSNPNGQNYYPGYGQQPPQPGYGAYGQPPGQPQYPSAPMPGSGQAPAIGPAPMPSGGRRGTSRALPVIVAAGLAVGVCGGLIMVLGTGESKAASQPEATTEDKEAGQEGGGSGEATTPTGTEVATVTPTNPEPPKPPPNDGPSPGLKVQNATIKFTVEPAEAKAMVTVDGKLVDSDTYVTELEPGKTKKVEIMAQATGYKPQTREYTIKGDDTVAFTLEKRAKTSSSTKIRGDRKRDKRDSKGLIDL